MFLQIQNYIKIIVKDSKQKCDACNFDSDKDKVKIHNIGGQRFTLYHKCHIIIEHKEILVTKHFNMKVFQHGNFRDKLLKEIAQMVNY